MGISDHGRLRIAGHYRRDCVSAMDFRYPMESMEPRLQDCHPLLTSALHGRTTLGGLGLLDHCEKGGLEKGKRGCGRGARGR